MRSSAITNCAFKKAQGRVVGENPFLRTTTPMKNLEEGMESAIIYISFYFRAAAIASYVFRGMCSLAQRLQVTTKKNKFPLGGFFPCLEEKSRREAEAKGYPQRRIPPPVGVVCIHLHLTFFNRVHFSIWLPIG